MEKEAGVHPVQPVPRNGGGRDRRRPRVVVHARFPRRRILQRGDARQVDLAGSDASRQERPIVPNRQQQIAGKRAVEESRLDPGKVKQAGSDGDPGLEGERADVGRRRPDKARELIEAMTLNREIELSRQRAEALHPAGAPQAGRSEAQSEIGNGPGQSVSQKIAQRHRCQFRPERLVLRRTLECQDKREVGSAHSLPVG